MNDIQEVWVNAALMPTGEIICEGRTIGWATDKPTQRRTNSIGLNNIRIADDYQLVPRKAALNQKIKYD